MSATHHPHSPALRAKTILALSYAAAFTLPIIGAVMSLVVLHNGGHASTTTSPAATQLVEDLIPLAISVAAAAIGMRAASKPPLRLTTVELGLRRSGDVTVSIATWTSLMYIAVLALAANGTQVVLNLMGVHQDASTAPGALIDSSWAGLMEEPILLGLTFALARRMRWRGSTVLALMIIMRIASHLYYGPGCLFIVPWMCAVYVLYRRCPLLWPFIVGHGIFDVLQTLYSDGSSTASKVASILEDVATVGGAVLALCLLYMRVRRSGGRLRSLTDLFGHPWQSWPRPGAAEPF